MEWDTGHANTTATTTPTTTTDEDDGDDDLRSHRTDRRHPLQVDVAGDAGPRVVLVAVTNVPHFDLA